MIGAALLSARARVVLLPLVLFSELLKLIEWLRIALEGDEAAVLDAETIGGTVDSMITVTDCVGNQPRFMTLLMS